MRLPDSDGYDYKYINYRGDEVVLRVIFADYLDQRNCSDLAFTFRAVLPVEIRQEWDLGGGGRERERGQEGDEEGGKTGGKRKGGGYCCRDMLFPVCGMILSK